MASKRAEFSPQRQSSHHNGQGGCHHDGQKDATMTGRGCLYTRESGSLLYTGRAVACYTPGRSTTPLPIHQGRVPPCTPWVHYCTHGAGRYGTSVLRCTGRRHRALASQYSLGRRDSAQSCPLSCEKRGRLCAELPALSLSKSC